MSSQDETNTSTTNEEKPISTASHKRRVHFPSDESQLRMISIAPEPSSDQPLSSLGVILQRYRAACQRLQIRPLNCLLDQLSTTDDHRKSFTDRLNCLKIINERLDLKHIDAIEEIFSRCRFYTLDFDSSFSDDSTLVQLFDVIEYYETCTHLNLSNNRSIGVQGYQALTRYLRKTRYLERLDMNSVRFDDTSMLGFGRSLRLSSTLYELHLESCQLNGKILQKFIQNLRSCPNLRELYLCDNRLQVQDSILINELIRSCGQFLHLIDLRSNSLQDNGMSHIASQLSQYDENHMQQNSIYKINFQANQLTHQGIAFLAKSLLHNRTIRSLNLSQNQITNEGLYLLRDALLTNRTINELILRNCRLTDQAAIALAEYIAESSTIQYIDLRENNIQASGICGMAIAMKTNKSLLKLDFDPITSVLNNSTNNNIDRATSSQTNSLLSLSNLRRMTVGLGGLTGGTASNANGTGDHSTRDLLEQKAKWMNDIECICQRNLLLYEDQQRKQQMIDHNEKAMTNGTDQQETSVTTPNDIHLEEKVIETNSLENGIHSIPAENEPSASDLQNNDENPQSTDIPVNEVEPSLDTIVNNNHVDEEVTDTSTNNNSTNEVEPSLDTVVHNNHVDEQTADTSTNNNNNNNTNEVEQITADTVEPLSNGGDNNQEEPSTNIIDEKSTLPDSSSLSDLIEDNLHDGDDDDEKRKIHHSDSLYLLRKKVQDEDDNTSDDESQLSSTMEPPPPSQPTQSQQQEIIDSV